MNDFDMTIKIALLEGKARRLQTLADEMKQIGEVLQVHWNRLAEIRAEMKVMGVNLPE